MATSTIRPRAVRAVWSRANTVKSSLRLSSISRSGTFDDHARHAAHLRADRQIPAPGRRVQAGALLDDDDVAGRSGFDRRRAEMTRIRSAFGAVQLDRQHPSRDASVGRKAIDPSDRPLSPSLSSASETAQESRRLSRATNSFIFYRLRPPAREAPFQPLGDPRQQDSRKRDDDHRPRTACRY